VNKPRKRLALEERITDPLTPCVIPCVRLHHVVQLCSSFIMPTLGTSGWLILARRRLRRRLRVPVTPQEAPSFARRTTDRPLRLLLDFTFHM
jgi:hypothetical protein